MASTRTSLRLLGRISSPTTASPSCMARAAQPRPPTTTTTTTRTRFFSSSVSSSSSSDNNNNNNNNSNTPFRTTPSPPRLPPSEQAEFERLQRAVADRFADPTPLPHEQQQQAAAAAAAHTSSSSQEEPVVKTGKTEELPTTGGVWRGAQPEFSGDTNPKTGEVGGPKTEPLRWGSSGDWSYNGRVTDF